MGINGKQVRAAWALTNTWGVAAAVKQQILLESLESFDAEPMFVDDNSFAQSWRGIAEIGDQGTRTQDLALQARLEEMDDWWAAGFGKAERPTLSAGSAAAISSATGIPSNSFTALRNMVNSTEIRVNTANAARSLTVNYSNSAIAANSSRTKPMWDHVIELAPQLATQMTLAASFDFEGSNADYVLEIPSFKVRGFTLSIGDNGIINASFPVLGSKGQYNSTTNAFAHVANSTAAADLGNRIFRKNCTVRMNDVSAGALSASDELTGLTAPLTKFSLDFTRPLTEDFVAGQDYIIEPDDDGFIDFPVSFEFARMTQQSANSMYNHMAAGKSYKCDMSFLGPKVNAVQQREMFIEMPTLQIVSWKASVSGHQQIRPMADLKMRTPNQGVAPAGMNFLEPARMTLRNTNPRKLLTGAV